MNRVNKIERLREFEGNLENPSSFQTIINAIKQASSVTKLVSPNKLNNKLMNGIVNILNKSSPTQELAQNMIIKNINSSSSARFFTFKKRGKEIRLLIIPDFIFDEPLNLEQIVFKNKSNDIHGTFASIYL